MESFVGPFGAAFSGEHTGRVFLLPLEGEDACGIGIFSGEVLLQPPVEDLAPVLIARYADAGYIGSREGLAVQGLADLSAAYVIVERLLPVELYCRGPFLDELFAEGEELLFELFFLVFERWSRGRIAGKVIEYAVQLIEPGGDGRLFFGVAVVFADGSRYLREVAYP